MSEREKGVDEIVAPYRKMISETPSLLSLLYDIDMLPEQTVTRAGAIRLAGLCEVWKARFREAIEAAAKVAETLPQTSHDYGIHADNIAKAIRALKPSD